MGFMWRHRSSSKKKSLAEMVVSREASVDGLVVNGSKEESFFDSMESLVSDYEDDFYSVRGDLTPSHDGTPQNQASASAPGTPPSKMEPHISSSPTSESGLSPRKKLSVLFQEAPPNDETDSEPTKNDKAEDKKGDEAIDDGSNPPPKPSDAAKDGNSKDGSKEMVANNHDATTIEDPKESKKEKNPMVNTRKEKVKSQKSIRCCLPCHSRTSSFNEKDGFLD